MKILMGVICIYITQGVTSIGELDIDFYIIVTQEWLKLAYQGFLRFFSRYLLFAWALGVQNTQEVSNIYE